MHKITISYYKPVRGAPMKVLFTFIPSQSLIHDIETSFKEVEFNFLEDIRTAEESLGEAEVIVTFGEDLTKDHILKAKNLRWIMVVSAGLELMPFETIKERNILVTNVRGIHKVPMAEFAFGLMLQYSKQLPRIRQQEESRTWKRDFPGAEICGKQLLVLGAGAIGGEIARLGKAFRMKVAGVNTSGKKAEFFDDMYTMDTLKPTLKQADYLISILPSTKETRYLLKKEHFSCMKESAVFINIGRGDLFEEEVLIEALENKEIAHAFLDVFEKEPLKDDHPFWKMKEVTVTPHLSSRTEHYLPRSFEIFKKNLTTYLNNGNDYINEINAERGY
jgi:phosphoglycerate dehydrogenase-like enzyme